MANPTARHVRVLQYIPSVGSALQIEVEGKGWETFLVYAVSERSVHLVKWDEPDFLEKVDLSAHEPGEPLPLPLDMRPVPDGITVPATSRTIVWAWCFDHLKSQARLGSDEVLLPGPDGSYKVFEVKHKTTTQVRWLKRVRAPTGETIACLKKLAHHLFAGQPVQLNLALAALVTDSAEAGDTEPAAEGSVCGAEGADEDATTEDSAAEGSVCGAEGADEDATTEDSAASYDASDDLGEDERDAERDAIVVISRGAELWKARKLGRDLGAAQSELSTAAARLERSHSGSESSIGVIFDGFPAKREYEKALLDVTVFARDKAAFADESARIEEIESVATKTTAALLEEARARLCKVDEAMHANVAMLRRIEGNVRTLAAAAEEVDDEGLTVGLRAAVLALRGSAETRDQAPIVAKQRHSRLVKRELKVFVASARAKLIRKTRATREAKQRRRELLERAAGEIARRVPDTISQYVTSSAAKHKVAAADLASKKSQLEGVRDMFAGVGSDLAKKELKEAEEEVIIYSSHVAVLSAADAEVCTKLEAMVPSLEVAIAMLDADAKRRFARELRALVERDDDRSNEPLPGTIAPFLTAVSALADAVQPPVSPPEPSTSSPLSVPAPAAASPPPTEGKKRKRFPWQLW